MNLYLPIVGLMTGVAVLGVPHSHSEHSENLQKKNYVDKFGTKSENSSDNDNLYKKEWDSYWESYYRNLMNKLNVHSYRGKKGTSIKSPDDRY